MELFIETTRPLSEFQIQDVQKHLTVIRERWQELRSFYIETHFTLHIGGVHGRKVSFTKKEAPKDLMEGIESQLISKLLNAQQALFNFVGVQVTHDDPKEGVE